MHFLQQGGIPKENHHLETKCPNTRLYGEHLSFKQSQVYSGQIVWQKEEKTIEVSIDCIWCRKQQCARGTSRILSILRARRGVGCLEGPVPMKH